MSGKSRKAIEKIVGFKMMAWLKSITDEELRNEVRRDLIVSGGCIASMLLGEEVNDYDVYLSNAQTAKKLANFYLDKLGKIDNGKISKVDIDIEPTGGWLPYADRAPPSTYDYTEGDDEAYWAIRTIKESDIAPKILETCPIKQLKISIKSAGLLGEGTDASQYQYFEALPFTEILKYFEKGFKTQAKKDYQLLFMSSNAISLSGGIQIITRFIGEPSEIHKCFDYVHVKNYFTFAGGLVLNAEAMESLLTKQLVYNNSMYPVSSIFRMRKFIRRGWSITAGEMFKIMFDVSKLNLSSPSVLMEQLTGADVAYFRQVLHILSQKKEGDIDKTYLFEVIDRVFKTNDLEDKDFTAEEIGEVTDAIKNDAISLGLDDAG